MSLVTPLLRILTLACTLLALVPLPFGLVDENVAVAAGIFGLYAVVPLLIVIAVAMLAARWSRVAARSTAAILLALVCLYCVYCVLVLGPYAAPGLLPAGIAVTVVARLPRVRR